MALFSEICIDAGASRTEMRLALHELLLCPSSLPFRGHRCARLARSGFLEGRKCPWSPCLTEAICDGRFRVNKNLGSLKEAKESQEGRPEGTKKKIKKKGKEQGRLDIEFLASSLPGRVHTFIPAVWFMDGQPPSLFFFLFFVIVISIIIIVFLRSSGFVGMPSTSCTVTPPKKKNIMIL